jgi:hypothetical protein
MADIANFNSEEYSWSEVEVFLAGAPVTSKLRGVSYKIESDDAEVFAGGDEAIAIKSGNITKSGTLKLLGGGVDALHAAVVAAGGRFIPDLKVDLVISYLPAIGRPIVQNTLIGVKFSSMPKGWNQGDKFMDCELPFKFLRYK